MQKGGQILSCRRDKFIFSIGLNLYENLKQLGTKKLNIYKERLKELKINKKSFYGKTLEFKNVYDMKARIRIDMDEGAVIEENQFKTIDSTRKSSHSPFVIKKNNSQSSLLDKQLKTVKIKLNKNYINKNKSISLDTNRISEFKTKITNSTIETGHINDKYNKSIITSIPMLNLKKVKESETIEISSRTIYNKRNKNQIGDPTSSIFFNSKGNLSSRRNTPDILNSTNRNKSTNSNFTNNRDLKTKYKLSDVEISKNFFIDNANFDKVLKNRYNNMRVNSASIIKNNNRKEKEK